MYSVLQRLQHPKNRRLRTIGIICLYVLVALLASYAYYLRFPNNYKYPNFYAEDVEYAQNIHDHGFLHAVTTPFLGYPIVGIYLLQGVAKVYNHIAYGGDLLTLPRSISVVSYLAMGWMAALPVLLLRKLLRPVMLTWLIVATVFVPLPLYDHAILGNTANLKFMALYVAVLLVIRRHYMTNKSRLYWLIDLGLLLCCLTDAVAFLLVPFAAVKYLKELLHAHKVRQLFRDPSFVSLALLVVCLGLEAVYVASHGIFHNIGGFYAHPYVWSETIEIFLARSYLFGFVYGAYPLLSNAITILLTAICILVVFMAYKYAPRRYAFAIVLSAVSILGATLFYIIGRPGLSTQYYDYRSGGFDQYFFAQNLVAYLIAAIAISGLLTAIRSRYLRSLVAVLPFVIFVQIPSSGTFGANNFMEEQRGTVLASASVACKNQPGQKVTFGTYPDVNPYWNFIADRDEVCTPETAAYISSPLVLGLQPDGSHAISQPGAIDRFTQTFTAPAPNLKGVLITFDTDLRPFKDVYRFDLMDASCTKILYSQTMNTMFLDTHYSARFPAIKNSQNRTYCFSVNIKDHSEPTQPRMIPLTAPGAYTKGQLTINGQRSDRAVVFGLIY